MSMNVFEDVDYGIHSAIPDFWTIFFEQHGDISMPVSIAHNVSGKSTIPLNTSTICHERIANYVVNFFTE